MNYNTDGFNDRSVYIHNSNDKSRIAKNGPSNIDSSVVQMRMDENKPDVKTVQTEQSIYIQETKGDKENFVLRNYNMRNSNPKIKPNNPVNNAMNRNFFNKF